MFELEGYTMPDFPERDEGQYPIAMVSLDSSGGCAYLTFADKAGYIIKLIAGDVWTGNAYTLGLTPEDTYDESKVIYEQSYVVMLDEAYKDALELLYPGITTTAWLRYTPPSTQTPSGGYYSLAMNYGPQWTNTDLYDEDGNLFLSAAGKKFPLREWLSWRIYGLCSRPLPMGARVPVAYLYNGVRLPGLPKEWNPVTHPFAFIVVNDYSNEDVQNACVYTLYMTSKEPVHSGTGDMVALFESVSYIKATFVTEALAQAFEIEYYFLWGVSDETISETGLAVHGYTKIVWSNFDMKNDLDELEVLFAASDPVPVYE